MRNPLPDYDLAPLNAAIANYQANPDDPAFQTKLVDELYRLGEAIGAAVDRKVGEADEVLKSYEAMLAEVVVDPEKIGPAHYVPLESLMDKDAPVGTDAAAILVAEGRQAVAARFYRHLKNLAADVNPDSVAQEAEAAAERGRAVELQQRQKALNSALDNFLANPKDESVQGKLAKQLAWFQECISKQEQARLAAAGIEKTMTGADDRANPMVAALESVMGGRKFTRQHADILEQLVKNLLDKATGEKTDSATQQASAVSLFLGYVWERLPQQERLPIRGSSGKRLNFLLATTFAVATLGLIMLGLSLTLPLIAPSLGFGLLLAPPLALGIAAASALLAPVGVFMLAAALRAANQATSFWTGVKDLSQRVLQSFRRSSTSPDTGFTVPGERGSLNAAPFSPSDRSLAATAKAASAESYLADIGEASPGKSNRPGI